MPAILTEHQQWVDPSGAPLVGGKVYFGDQNADPIANPQTIFSDRALTIPIANPQILDANGRTTNKVWIAGRYSIRVDNVTDVQQYQELDNGETVSTGVTQLENVLGGDVITATATTTITSYTDLELFIFTTASANTGPVTLNVDTVGADAIVKNLDQPLVDGDFGANQVVIVVRNNTNGNFEWVNHNDKVVNFSKGTAVVSATVTDIWAKDGNTLHVTGDTGPIMSFGVAPNAGAVRWVIFDGTPTLEQSANLNLPGGVDFVAAAGDFARVYADTTVQLDVQLFKADGTAIVVDVISTLGTVLTPTGTTADFTGIAPGTRHIIISFEGLSNNSSSTATIVQIGDSGGIETTGYASVFSSNGTAALATAGFGLERNPSATRVWDGSIILTLLDPSTNTWSATGNVAVPSGTGSPQMLNSAGSKSLSAELDRVRVTMVNGTAVFDAGKVNILYF